MEFVIEILLEIYMEFMTLIIPEKNISKKHKVIAAILAIAVLAGVFALVIWGVTLIVDHGNLLGIMPITVAVLISVFQIVAGIILFKKNH